MDSASLLVHCQAALGLTQKQLGELLGRDRRTILRWQDKGFTPMPELARTLADALRPVRPDLADQVLELARAVAIPGVTALSRPATEEEIAAILQAAAEAGGATTEAIRPAVTAAFRKAEEAGLEVEAVVEALTPAS